MKNFIVVVLLFVSSVAFADEGQTVNATVVCKSEASLAQAAALEKLANREPFRDFVATAHDCIVLPENTTVQTDGESRQPYPFYVRVTTTKGGEYLADVRAIRFKPNSILSR